MEPTAEIREFGKKAVEELDARLVWLQSEWLEINSKRNAWLLILGEGETLPSQNASTPEQSEATTDAQGKDITEVARQIISSTGDAGFQPKDVTAKLKKIGFEVSQGFASNLLFRLKRKGELVEHDKRYYLPKFDPKPRLNMTAANNQGATEATP